MCFNGQSQRYSKLRGQRSTFSHFIYRTRSSTRASFHAIARSFLVVPLSLCFVTVVFAQGISVGAIGLDGKKVSLNRVKFLPGFLIEGQDQGKAVSAACLDLLSLRFSDKSPPARVKGSQVLFPTGEVLGGEIIASDNSNLKVKSPLVDEFSAPLSTVQGFIVDPAASESQIDDAAARIRLRGRQGDVLLLKNKDVLAGTFEGIDAEKVRFTLKGKQISVARDLVLAVGLDPTLLDYKPGNDFFGQLRLADGGVVNAKGLESQAGRLKVQTMFGPLLIVDPVESIDLSFRNGRVVYVSDLTPLSAQTKPFFDAAAPHRLDRSVLGGPIRLAGKPYAKGIGVRSKCELVFDAAGFDRFEATIGVDDGAGDQASVQFIVKLDGKQVYDSGEMTSAAEPKPISVPLKGAKRIELIVDYAKRGDVQDYADWADARLIR